MSDSNLRVIGKTGSFAQTNLPQAVTGNTFNADNEMTAFNGTPLSYDANGNLTNDGTNAYTWDARNHLTAMSGGAIASFIYDANWMPHDGLEPGPLKGLHFAGGYRHFEYTLWNWAPSQSDRQTNIDFEKAEQFG